MRQACAVGLLFKSYRFQIDSSYTCGRAKTLHEDGIFFFFLTAEKKSCIFKRIRIRVNGAFKPVLENVQ